MSEKHCEAPGCDSRGPRLTAGYCQAHYKRLQVHGDVMADVPVVRKKPAERPCAVPGCDRRGQRKDLCTGHYQRLRKHGDVQADKPLGRRGGTCTVGGCEGPSRGRGLCGLHYERQRRTGTTDDPEPKVYEPILASTGYLIIWHEGRYVSHHRYVWERERGPLLPGQEIHHKNGVKTDNRLSNLELWDTSQPAGQRPEDKVDHAVEMLRRYAPELLR